MTSTLTRKPITALVLGFLCLLAMASCRKPADQPAGDGLKGATAAGVRGQADAGQKAPIEIVFSHALEGQAARALEDAVAGFDRSRDDLTVKIVREERRGRETSLEDAILAGRGPDAFLAGDMFAREWIERKHLMEPLGRMLAARGVSPADVWQERYLSRVTSAGMIYGLPLAIRVPILVANPDVVTNGCDMSASTAANAKRPLAIDASDWRIVSAFMQAWGGEIVDGTGMPAFDSDGAAVALGFLGAQLKAGGLRAVAGSNDAIELFNAGGVAAAIVWPEQLAGISADRAWILMPMPAIEGAGKVAPWWQTDVLFVSSWSRHREAAADLLVWLTSEGRILSLARDGLPGLFVTKRDMPSDYTATQVSRGIRTQQTASIPSPDFATIKTTVDIFDATVWPLISAPGRPDAILKYQLSESAGRARAVVTKIRQGQSLILR